MEEKKMRGRKEGRGIGGDEMKKMEVGKWSGRREGR